MSDATAVLEVTVTEERYPRYHPARGTPDPMLRRLATIRTASGSATFEQTDYGHPGKLNPWDPRGIDAKLQAQANDLRTLCEALGRLLP
jgi:hypothetical protein